MDVVAVYLRLSVEDRTDSGISAVEDGSLTGRTDAPGEGGADESNSISSQRMLISSYIERDAELREYGRKEFCDDGWSGSGMDRPGMNRLMDEVKKNQVQCIIVKDLSRFSRDYIELGTYMNQILPFMGVRLIAVADHYDSREHRGSTIGLDTAFKTLLNDLYSKDISVKVKASLGNKYADGEYAFGQAPFGYGKSAGKKNEVVVNEKESAIVRKIFALACQGKSSTEIARLLHEGGVPTARQMRGVKTPEGGTAGTWSSSSVRSILKNRFYLGEMSYGKTVQEHVGSRKKKRTAEKDWKVIPGHHQPLVTPEEFEKASSSVNIRHTERKREKHPLVGRLSCGGCGYAMVYKPLRPGNPYRRFECSRHSILKIPECCTYFRADLLEETVLTMINRELMLRGEAAQQAESLAGLWKAAMRDIKDKISSLCIEKKRAEDSRCILYEKYALGEISQEEYQKSASDASGEAERLSGQIKAYTKKAERLSEEQEKLQADMRQVIRFSHMESLTQELVNTFIRKIYVYKDKRVEIVWDFEENVI
ncbi:MAG: recombinase family protein [Eubacterium sp.]|nr:recombinase family protein [Eubacterium sp.]